MPDHGVYVMEVRLPRPTNICVGALGVFDFPPGLYLYVGSARRALASRLARHMRRTKVMHWHIDYLTVHAAITRILVAEWAPGRECRVARALSALEGVTVPVPGFGASDCTCRAHLFAVDAAVDWSAELAHVTGCAWEQIAID